MGGGQGRGRHQDGAHAHGMGGGQIARIVLEHGGGAGIYAIAAKNLLEGVALGLGAKTGMFHPVDGIKQPGQPPRGQHISRIRGRAIGIDNPPPWQGCDFARQRRVGGQHAEIDIMHLVQIGFGIDLVFAHQPGQGGAIARPIGFAQVVGLGVVHAQLAHHILRHALFDLIKQAHFWRV